MQKLFSKTTNTGLDIDQNQVYLVTLRKTSRGISIQNSITGTLVKIDQYAKHKITVAIADSELIKRAISLDHSLAKDEIMQYLLNNTQKIIGFPQEEINLDFKIIATNKKNVEIIAVKKNIINQKQEQLKKLSFKINAIEPESHALARAVIFSSCHQDSVIAINIKTNKILIILVNKKILLHSKEMSYNKANIIEQINYELQNLITECNCQINKIFLSGNIQTISMLKEKLQKNYCAKICFPGLSENLDKNDPKLFLSFGLALRGLL